MRRPLPRTLVRFAAQAHKGGEVSAINPVNREKGAVPGLGRLNPATAVALHRPMRIETRGASLFETLEALSRRAVALSKMPRRRHRH